MKNVLVTFVSGDKFLNNLDCEIFLNSLLKFKNFDKVCFVHNISTNEKESLKRFFDFVVDSEHNINVPNCDRFIVYYEWLKNKKNIYKNILHVDFRDVIIQKNPFEYMDKNADYNMFFALEGMKISESECNSFWANGYHKLLQDHKYDFNNDYIINAGTIGASLDVFLQFCLLVFTNTNRKSAYVVFEQPVMNYLYRYLSTNEFIKLCHPKDSLFCATGEGIQYNFVDVTFENNFVCNKDGEPYYIFHQWDRTSVAESIRNKFKNELNFSI